MNITYLFDPLCGWCYGANNGLTRLAGQHTVRLLPTGLFSETGRIMDAEFAEHAWSNDQRIAELTGLPFSHIYRQNILNQPTPFDSFHAVAALAAVQAVAPAHTFGALKNIQSARFVRGLDIADWAVLAQILRETDLAPAADALLSQTAHYQQAAREWIAEGRALAQQTGARGVPQIATETETGWQLLDSRPLFQTV